jgi:hypothetical protein
MLGYVTMAIFQVRKQLCSETCGLSRCGQALEDMAGRILVNWKIVYVYIMGYFTVLSVSRLCSIRWQYNWWIMNWKGCGREWAWAWLEVQSWNLPGRISVSTLFCFNELPCHNDSYVLISIWCVLRSLIKSTLCQLLRWSDLGEWNEGVCNMHWTGEKCF